MKTSVYFVRTIVLVNLSSSLSGIAKASDFKCRRQAELTVKAILSLQEARPVAVRIQHSSLVSGPLGTIETFDIQGYGGISKCCG